MTRAKCNASLRGSLFLSRKITFGNDLVIIHTAFEEDFLKVAL